MDVKHAKRLVIKIGSALLVQEETGHLHRAWLDSLADDIARFQARGQHVIIVSSGASALGRRKLGLKDFKTLKLDEKQAAAATGQIELAHAFQETLARHHINVAQILLTPDDTEDRRRHLNARATLEMLLKHNIIPIINENDTVATAEIRFGDNDRLAARVAQMISADTLILLSDIDGLYTKDPKKHSNARHIPEVTDITPEIEKMAGKPTLGYSSGGMPTKLMAAKIAASAGASMIITQGKHAHPLQQLEEGARHTVFLPTDTPKNARKRWIAGHLKPAGHVVIDDGAARALEAGKSLLPAGITAVTDGFEPGDLIAIHNQDNSTIACGLVNYSAKDSQQLIGHHTRDIKKILGYRGPESLIHSDNLVITKKGS